MRRRRHDGKMPGAVLTQIAHAVLELCVQREDRLALLVERHRLRSRKQPVVDALEQRKAGLRLHRLQRIADRGLRQRQFVRRRHRGAVADDGTQDLELAQVHITADYTLG